MNENMKKRLDDLSDSWPELKPFVKEAFEIMDKETQENVKELEEVLNGIETDDPAALREAKKMLSIFKKRADRKVSDAFGEKLSSLRKDRRLTLKDMEALTGISGSYINKMEKGKRGAPTLPIMQKLADALKVDISELMDTVIQEHDKKTEQTIADVLLKEEFSINGKAVTPIQKKQIAELVECVFNSDWDEETINEDQNKLYNIIKAIKSGAAEK